MNDRAILDRLNRNWQQVQEQVNDAANRAGRDPNSVTIVGVSKYVDADMTQALVEVGCRNLGESRPQLMWSKAEALATCGQIHWHLIGHLQRNKIRRTLGLNDSLLIHSIDSDRLLDSLATESIQQSCTTRALLEVNISDDSTKTGLSQVELTALIERLPVPGVEVRGLMAMAGWGTDPEDARRQFGQVRQLRDELQDRCGILLPELSMGMSGDFPQAIMEGATIVRVGSRLFDGLVPR